ncbi:hypothetical protein BLA29_009891, partial [Euroglyphus maynei]
MQPATSAAPSTTQPYISYFNPFESTMKEQSTFDQSMDEKENRQQNTQQQQQPSLVDAFTFVSSGNNSAEYHQQIFTTFEEAFKNYYDSQNRISNNNNNDNYYTLPLKTSGKDKVKDSHHRNQRNRIVYNRQQRKNYSSSPNVIAKQESTHPEFTEEIPFHVAIIEPPEDYQNLFPDNQRERLTKDNNNNEQKTQPQTKVDDLIETNQLLQYPYRYWLEQMNPPM